jgi:hypothetical protein
MKRQNIKKAVIKIFKIFDNGNVDDLDAIIKSIDHQLILHYKTGLAELKVSATFMSFPGYEPLFIHCCTNDTVYVHSTSIGTTAETIYGTQIKAFNLELIL